MRYLSTAIKKGQFGNSLGLTLRWAAGKLAKIDARAFAHFGEALRPQVREPPEASFATVNLVRVSTSSNPVCLNCDACRFAL